MIPIILANNYHRVFKCSYSNQNKAGQMKFMWNMICFFKALRSLLRWHWNRTEDLRSAGNISGIIIIVVFYSPVTLPWYYLLHGKTVSVLSVSIIREWQSWHLVLFLISLWPWYNSLYSTTNIIITHQWNGPRTLYDTMTTLWQYYMTLWHFIYCSPYW